jgi:beta-mannosidase
MRKFIETHLPYPRDFNSTEALPAMLYMAQVNHAMAQKTQTEYYRRLMDDFNQTDGTGYNMGALYWQLNDIWEGCSWTGFGKFVLDCGMI